MQYEHERLVIALEKMAEASDRLTAAIDQLLNAPTNAYGENLVTAMQNGIVRGTNGITTY